LYFFFQSKQDTLKQPRFLPPAKRLTQAEKPPSQLQAPRLNLLKPKLLPSSSASSLPGATVNNIVELSRETAQAEVEDNDATRSSLATRSPVSLEKQFIFKVPRVKVPRAVSPLSKKPQTLLPTKQHTLLPTIAAKPSFGFRRAVSDVSKSTSVLHRQDANPFVSASKESSGVSLKTGDVSLQNNSLEIQTAMLSGFSVNSDETSSVANASRIAIGRSATKAKGILQRKSIGPSSDTPNLGSVDPSSGRRSLGPVVVASEVQSSGMTTRTANKIVDVKNMSKVDSFTGGHTADNKLGYLVKPRSSALPSNGPQPQARKEISNDSDKLKRKMNNHSEDAAAVQSSQLKSPSRASNVNGQTSGRTIGLKCSTDAAAISSAIKPKTRGLLKELEATSGSLSKLSAPRAIMKSVDSLSISKEDSSVKIGDTLPCTEKDGASVGERILQSSRRNLKKVASYEKLCSQESTRSSKRLPSDDTTFPNNLEPAALHVKTRRLDSDAGGLVADTEKDEVEMFEHDNSLDSHSSSIGILNETDMCDNSLDPDRLLFGVEAALDPNMLYRLVGELAGAQADSVANLMDLNLRSECSSNAFQSNRNTEDLNMYWPADKMKSNVDQLLAALDGKLRRNDSEDGYAESVGDESTSVVSELRYPDDRDVLSVGTISTNFEARETSDGRNVSVPLRNNIAGGDYSNLSNQQDETDQLLADLLATRQKADRPISLFSDGSADTGIVIEDEVGKGLIRVTQSTDREKITRPTSLVSSTSSADTGNTVLAVLSLFKYQYHGCYRFLSLFKHLYHLCYRYLS